MQESVPVTLKKLGLALLGQALPQASALSAMLGQLRRALMASVIAAVMLSVALLIGCYAFYIYLIAQGLGGDIALALTAGLVLLVALIGSLLADRHITRAAAMRQKLGLFTDDGRQDQADHLEAVVAGFVEGLCATAPSPETAHEEPETVDDEPTAMRG